MPLETLVDIRRATDIVARWIRVAAKDVDESRTSATHAPGIRMNRSGEALDAFLNEFCAGASAVRGDCVLGSEATWQDVRPPPRLRCFVETAFARQ